MNALLTELIAGPFGAIKVTLNETTTSKAYDVHYSGYLVSSDENIAHINGNIPQLNARSAATAFAERCSWAERYTSK